MVNKLTAKDVIAALNLDLDSFQELKITNLLNQIYSKSLVSENVVLDTILKIYLADPKLTSIDDIYLVVYGNVVKLEFKYSFWPKRLTELGVFKVVDAYIVREGDEFEISIENEKTEIKHKQNPFKNNGAIIGAYARGIKEDGSVVIATATREELDMAAKASKVKNKNKTTIWDVWFSEVAKKVPLKRLVKLIPVPSEITQAVNLEAENYATPNEVAEADKDNDSINALDELNQEVSSQPKQTLKDVLDKFEIEYELKQGYIKVSKEDIKKSLLSDEDLPLKEFKKDENYLIGKASDGVELKAPVETTVEEIKYEDEQ